MKYNNVKKENYITLHVTPSGSTLAQMDKKLPGLKKNTNKIILKKCLIESKVHEHRLLKWAFQQGGSTALNSVICTSNGA